MRSRLSSILWRTSSWCCRTRASRSCPHTPKGNEIMVIRATMPGETHTFVFTNLFLRNLLCSLVVSQMPKRLITEDASKPILLFAPRSFPRNVIIMRVLAFISPLIFGVLVADTPEGKHPRTADTTNGAATISCVPALVALPLANFAHLQVRQAD